MNNTRIHIAIQTNPQWSLCCSNSSSRHGSPMTPHYFGFHLSGDTRYLVEKL